VIAVDDNSDARELLKAILEKSGAEAIVVSSGQEALAAMKNVHPDVLVCDLGMAEMDGYELLENVRRLEPRLGQTPAIAFTAAAFRTGGSRGGSSFVRRGYPSSKHCHLSCWLRRDVGFLDQ
jgi:CheY-like chemotaxis protein